MGSNLPDAFLFLLFFAVILVIFSTALRRRAEAFRAIATEVSGAVERGGFLRSPRIKAMIDGRMVTLRHEPGGKNHPGWYRAELEAPLQTRVAISKEGFGSSFLKWTGFGKEITVGDPDFDGKFYLKVSDEVPAQMLLSNADLRARIRDLFEGLGLASVELGPDVISVRRLARRLGEEERRNLVRLMREAASLAKFSTGV